MEIKEVTVNAKALADLFGVTEKYISELVLTQNMPKSGYGEFKLYDCVKWYIDYKQQSHRKEVQKIKNEDEQKRLTRANAALKELALKEKEGELIPYEKVKSAWLDEMKILAVAFDGIPAKAAIELEGNTKQEMQGILKKHIDEAREKIGNQF